MTVVRWSRCRTALLVCLLVAGGAHVLAETPPANGDNAREPTRVQAGIGILGALPMGEFATRVPDGAGGVLGHLDVGVGRSMVSFGGEIGWLNYGDEDRKVSAASLIVPGARSETAKVNTSNSIFTAHGRVRVQPRRGRWRPYVDGLVGFMDLYTKSHVDGGTLCVQYCIDIGPSETHSRDFVASYGGGGGIMIGFSARERAPRLDLSVRYLKGGTAEYLTEGAVREEGDRLILDFSRSSTNMVMVYIGVAFGR